MLFPSIIREGLGCCELRSTEHHHAQVVMAMHISPADTSVLETNLRGSMTVVRTINLSQKTDNNDLDEVVRLSEQDLHEMGAQHGRRTIRREFDVQILWQLIGPPEERRIVCNKFFIQGPALLSLDLISDVCYSASVAAIADEVGKLA